MATSDYTLNLLKKLEGYTAKPKWDEKQYSVGYSTKWVPGQPIGTREDHENALRREAGQIDDYINKNVTAPLDDNKRAALTSFGYNLGPGGIQKLLPDINAGNWDKVASRMLSFSRAGDNPNALTDRRREEAGILLGGPLPESASAPSTRGASAPQEGDMLNILAALGGGGAGGIMGSLGKMIGSEAMTKAGGQNSIFGSLNSMFGGEDQQGSNAVGDANMKLAQGAQQAAGAGEESIPTYQRRPVDLSNLMKIIQQRSQLGAAPRQPGTGMGA